MAEKKVIKKENWVSNFNLIGKPVIGDYTFKIDEKSDKSNWIYNAMNLGVDCGERAGTVYCELMGGYAEGGNNKIYAHGKTENGQDDFEQKIEVDWEDRNNEDVLEEIGSLSFIRVGLEKTSEGKNFYKDFLSPYDAIAYIKDHLTEDMVVNVRGNLKYSSYNDNVQVRKNITSIVLSKADDSSKYKATFTQSILLDKDSANLKNIDKDKGVMYVDAKVLDYLKEYNGIEVKGQYPYAKRFEFEFPNLEDGKQCKTIFEKIFKVKKDVTQITMEGEFIESGAMVTATWEDVPDDIKDLVAMGVYSEEEALAKCTANGNKERRMVLKKPMVKMVGNDDEDKRPVLQMFPEKFTEDALVLDYLYKKESESNDDNVPFDTDTDSEGGQLDWLNAL